MMIDPVTALSVAGSIVQIVDFGIRVLSKGKHIYHSADGTLSADHDLEAVTTDLPLLQAKLQQSWRPVDVLTALTDEEQRMHDLCLSCDSTAQKLLDRLNMAKAQGRPRRWKSLRQAVKSICSKHDIEEMSNSLHNFRTQLNTHLLVSLRSVLPAMLIFLE